MKIVCDACQAKYSISDDKVQGKVFKIRCKKCSNIIVVRGGQNAAEQAPAPAVEKDTRVYDYGYDGAQGAAAGGGGDESVWHVVINQDQVGPMTVAEVQQRFAAGEIDADTYIWRESFADWLPISQVDAFADYVSSGSTTAAVSSRAGQDAVASMFGGGGGSDESGTVRSDPGDLFAAASAGSGRHQQPEDDGDMFGSKAPRAAAQPAQSADAAGSKLRGERNENSVLFSLGNLAQLASDKPAPVTAAPSSSHGGGGGQSGGEGSGLIDIRSMANAYLGGGGGGAGMAAKASTSSAIGSMDDLPVFGTGGFSEPAVMMPTAARQSNNKLMLALIGSVGILAVAAVILVVVLVSGGDDKTPTVAKTDNTSANGKTNGGGDDEGSSNETGDSSGATGDTGSSNSGTPDNGSAEPAVKGGTDEPATGKDPEPEKQPAVEPDKTEKPVKAEKPSSSKPDKTERPSSSKPDKTEKPAKPDKPVKAETPSSGGGCDEVGCVISGYEGTCCAKFKKGGKTTTTTTGGKSDLPSSLDRAAISEGVGKVKGRVMACGDKSSAKGTVKVSVKVTADGNVSSVTVKESPDSSLGSCVSKAMEKASFKKTQGGGSFSYPFVF